MLATQRFGHDRETNAAFLKPAPRVYKNMLARLKIRCGHKVSGCKTLVQLDMISDHENKCVFNPTTPVACTKGCGLTITRGKLPTHDCIQELGSRLAKVEVALARLTTSAVESEGQNDDSDEYSEGGW